MFILGVKIFYSLKGGGKGGGGGGGVTVTARQVSLHNIRVLKW